MGRHKPLTSSSAPNGLLTQAVYSATSLSTSSMSCTSLRLGVNQAVASVARSAVSPSLLALQVPQT